MDPLNNASALNNWGVNLLEFNDTVCAIDTFQRAVHMMKHFTDSVVTIQLDLDFDQPSMLPSLRRPSTGTAVSSFQLRTGTKLDCLGKGVYYTYDRPILLPTDNKISTPEEFNSNMVVSGAILVFNFGMACHQLGTQSGQEASLRQAVRIYELTLNMLHQTGIHESYSMVLMCLALNNLANIHSDLCDYESCESCLECVRDLLMDDANIDSFALEFIDESDWTELKLNLMYAQNGSAAAA
jgi:hypothetical protein